MKPLGQSHTSRTVNAVIVLLGSATALVLILRAWLRDRRRRRPPR